MEVIRLFMAAYGTPGLLAVLVGLNIYQATVIKQLQKEVGNIKDSITWSDTCDTRHEEISRRLDRIEKKVFNNG